MKPWLRWRLIALPVVIGLWGVLFFWTHLTNVWAYLVIGTLAGLLMVIYAEFR